MASRAHREEVARRAREALARGPMDAEEEAEFASQQAAEDREAWLRRRPELRAPELQLRRAA